MAEPKKVSWNASQGIIMEISQRRSMANSYYIQGQIKKAINTLISIKQSVIQSFTEKERGKLKEIEERFDKISGALNKNFSASFNKRDREAASLAHRLARKIYSDYNDKLMDLLEDRGYLIGEQTDASSMKF